MRPITLVAPLLLLGACSESDFNFSNVPAPQPIGELLIRGQVCDPELQIWMEGALVYTHLYDEDGVVFDTVTDTTDAEGRYTLEGLAGGYEYEIYVQKGQSLIEKFRAKLPEDGNLDIPPPPCFGEVDMQVAVITGAYDDMEKVFQIIGVGGYHLINGQVGSEIVDFFASVENLAEYQVIFFNGGHKEEGVIYGDGPEVQGVRNTLRTWVEGGGTLYVTDWAYDVVETIWPDPLDFLGDDSVPDAAQRGEPGTIQATVVDPGLLAAVGVPAANVVYDLSEWPLIEDVSEGTTVYLEGDAQYRVGFDVYTVPKSPLLVEFPAGDGRVIVSTFRNSANSSGESLAILQALISTLD